jgi:glycosyltransferase involved in cell wall biosynthesis
MLGVLRRLGLNAGSHAHRAADFLRILRRVRPDIVHVHFAYSYYAWLAAVLGCRPLAVTVMGGDVLFEEQGEPSRLGKWLTLEVLRQADYITSKSDYLIQVLNNLGGFGDKAERIIWGIPLGHFRRLDAAPLRAKLALKPGERVVLSPKILQPFYRIHLVVEAMAQVVRAVPGAVLLITEYAADPAYRRELQARIDALGLGASVRFCGDIAHAEMPLYYSVAEMTVAVPSSDGLPQTLLEGMACETPSVLGRLPRYEEIVRHRESAYFVDDDPASIASGIVDLLGDAPLRERIARNALAIVREQGNLDEQAGRVERRFGELARTRAPRAWDPHRVAQAWRRYRAFAREARA